MELFGLTFSIPFFASMSIIYRALLKVALRKWEWLAPLFWPVSVAVLVLLAVELAVLIAFGILPVLAAARGTFECVHLIALFLALPAITNILMIQRKLPFLSKWYVVAFVCVVLGLTLALLNIGIDEAMYGVDNSGGPYGHR
jgi:hypothetical protein